MKVNHSDNSKAVAQHETTPGRVYAVSGINQSLVMRCDELRMVDLESGYLWPAHLGESHMFLEVQAEVRIS